MLISIKNLSKTYNFGKENANQALSNINLNIDKGEMIAIMGPSGAGKSTLLHILAGLIMPESGEYYFNNQNVQSFSSKKLCQMRNKEIGIVLQNFALIEDYSLLYNVMIPLFFSHEKMSISNKKSLSEKALDDVGILKLKDKYLSEVSGGEVQRCAIARAIINNPLVIIADEPTGQLDTKTADEIMLLFQKLNEKGTTILIVTHDERIANKCQRIIKISDGKIIFDSKE